jgi:hypothetical protein
LPLWIRPGLSIEEICAHAAHKPLWEAQFSEDWTFGLLARSPASKKKPETQLPEINGLEKSQVSIYFENKPRPMFWTFGSIVGFLKNISSIWPKIPLLITT